MVKTEETPMVAELYIRDLLLAISKQVLFHIGIMTQIKVALIDH